LTVTLDAGHTGRLVNGAIAILVASVTWIVAALGPADAGATFPGQNGKLAFFRDDGSLGRIFAMDPDGQNQMPLSSGAGGIDFAPTFSADGERIAFVHETGPDEVFWEIAVMDADGQNQMQLTTNSLVDAEPAFSPDGRRIAFSRYEGGTDTEIFVMDSDGQNPTPLTDSPLRDAAPDYSPNGQTIAYEHFDGSDTEIYLMGADGSNPAPLTNTPGNESDPDFSPDGSRVVFTRQAGMADTEVFVIGADGQNEMQLTDNAQSDFNPTFSPDGQKIAVGRFTDPALGEIVVMDADGQNQTPLTADTFNDRDPDWQPLNPPACQLSGKTKSKTVKRIEITVECQNENATVLVEGTVQAPKIPKLAAGASKAKKVTLPPTSTEVVAGQPTTVTIPVPKQAQKTVKKAHRAGKNGKAKLTVTATDDLGASAQDPFKLKFKAKK
jgi:Tol biopolymer transport system component